MQNPIDGILASGRDRMGHIGDGIGDFCRRRQAIQDYLFGRHFHPLISVLMVPGSQGNLVANVKPTSTVPASSQDCRRP